MKVKIKKYASWFGPFQLTNKLLFWMQDDDRKFLIGDKYSQTWLGKAHIWLGEKWMDFHDNRRVNVKIDKWDTWNMDESLAHIIVPMLKQLKEEKHGAPFVDDEDVPENLRSTNAEPKENDYDTDSNHFLRWDYVMDEMIWAFEQKITNWEQQYYSGESDVYFEKLDDDSGMSQMKRGPNDTFKVDMEGRKAHQERMTNGYKLFGKYFESLWD